jgi:hypothetical protein
MESKKAPKMKCYFMMKYIYQIDEIEKALLKLNPDQHRYGSEIVNACFKVIEKTEEGMNMRFTGTAIEKNIALFVKSKTETKIGDYISKNDDGRLICLKYDQYQSCYNDLVNDVMKNKMMFFGTTPICVEMPGYGLVSKLKLNGKFVLIPHCSESLAITFWKMEPSWTLTQIQEIPSSDERSEGCVLATFIDDKNEDKEIIFSIYASNLQSNDSPHELICLIDDRRFEVCTKEQQAMHVQSILDLQD